MTKTHMGTAPKIKMGLFHCHYNDNVLESISTIQEDSHRVEKCSLLIKTIIWLHTPVTIGKQTLQKLKGFKRRKNSCVTVVKGQRVAGCKGKI